MHSPVTTNAVTEERTVAFALEGKVNSDTVKLDELYKTKGLQDQCNSHRMLEKGAIENTNDMLNKDLGDMESDTDAGLFTVHQFSI